MKANAPCSVDRGDGPDLSAALLLRFALFFRSKRHTRSCDARQASTAEEAWPESASEIRAPQHRAGEAEECTPRTRTRARPAIWHTTHERGCRLGLGAAAWGKRQPPERKLGSRASVSPRLAISDADPQGEPAKPAFRVAQDRFAHRMEVSRHRWRPVARGRADQRKKAVPSSTLGSRRSLDKTWCELRWQAQAAGSCIGPGTCFEFCRGDRHAPEEQLAARKVLGLHEIA